MGLRVHSYIKGHGKPVSKDIKITGVPVHRPVITESTDLGKAKNWQISFIYKRGDAFTDDDKEVISVYSDNYKDAEAKAWNARRYQTKKPVAVDVDDPNILGAINSALHSDTAQRIHTEMLRGASQNLQSKGLLGRVIAGKLGEKVSEADYSRLSKRAKKLLDDAFSDDKSIRTLARSRLQKEFPSLYEQASFSTGGAEQAHQRNLETMKYAHELSQSGKVEAQAKYKALQNEIVELKTRIDKAEGPDKHIIENKLNEAESRLKSIRDQLGSFSV